MSGGAVVHCARLRGLENEYSPLTIHQSALPFQSRESCHVIEFQRKDADVPPSVEDIMERRKSANDGVTPLFNKRYDMIKIVKRGCGVGMILINEPNQAGFVPFVFLSAVVGTNTGQ
ncbi:hypothetical protein Fmac_002910 [Flemingia macrophylla]|uniref:Uncharacterized protein n=1 Tax=Flemingia macrophylla TaxID=520843 RepID=A0ABD1NLA6_9FABA